MKFKSTCSPQARGSVAKKFISSSLAVGLLFNTTLPSLASTLSEDGRYESFEGDSITIDDVLEEDKVDVEIQGNTMVNYAQDGDKELTLNGDIDVEGNYITTTEGVDNGLVDVEIEGNTLIVDKDGNEVEPGAEGAKLVSVGQDNIKGHSINITSYDNTFEKGTYVAVASHYCKDVNNTEDDKVRIRTDFIPVEEGDDINMSVSNEYKIGLTLCDENKYILKHYEANTSSRSLAIEDSNVKYVRFVIRKGYEGVEAISPVDIYSSLESNILEFKLNKKEIQLNEPLRGLPNGVKDRIIKKDGKWYVERNCIEERVDSSYTWIKSSVASNYYYTTNDKFRYDNQNINVICNALKSETILNANDKNYYNNNENYISLGTWSHVGALSFDLNPNLLSEDTVEGFEEYLEKNEIYIIYPRTTPIYEPLEIEPILNTYSDVTHVSNNSTIPCNMKVQNTGYNAIIKPNTQYTVALDTNKTGTVGINLGGAKVTTTNNVAVVTTPSTLVDDSLRICGKGIKVSNIRVLEGDKTDNIPSYFEGIKSSFEDKLQDGGSYKMEISSNNKNLLNLDILETSSTTTVNKNSEGKLYFTRHGGGVQGRVLVNTKIRKGKKYNISFNVTNIPSTANLIIYTSSMPISNINYRKVVKNLYLPNIGYNTYCSDFIAEQDGYLMFETDYSWEEIQINNLQLIESKDYVNYIPQKSNKIQFLSTEPLRAVGDIKDRIIKRNGQWVVERNCKELTLDGSENWYFEYGKENTMAFYTFDLIGKTNQDKNIICDKFITASDMMISYDSECVKNANGFYINIDKLKLSTLDVNGLKQWLQENPIKVVYQLAEPIYEPLNIEPTVNLYEGTTHILNNSNIPANMKVVIDRTINRASEAIELAKTSPTVENLARARMWTNLLKDSTMKDELQDEITSITEVEGLAIEKKSVTANMDLYVKSENTLSMSLDTNSVTFEGYSGVSDMEKLGAVNISINSSLPYSLNAYMPVELSNSDGSNKMPTNLLNIRQNGESEYKRFASTTDKIILKNDCEAGNDIVHKIDLKLSSTDAHKSDIYKAVVKFEAEQK